MQSNSRTPGGRYMMTADINLRKASRLVALSVAILSLAAIPTQHCVAQTRPTTVAALHDSDSAEKGRTATATNGTDATAEPAATPPDPEISPAVAKQLATMQAEIE